MESTIGSRKRRPSISDVATLAGVSPAAVSKVIRDAYGVSPAMRERVQSAIAELNYRPRIAARSMRGSSFTLGFEIPHLGNEFFTQIVRGATNQLEGSGYQLIIAPSAGDLSGEPALDSLADRQVDGIIAISPAVAPEWLERLAGYVPIVLLGRHDDPVAYDTVTNDDIAGTEAMLDHLLSLGHRDIAHLTIHAAADPALSRSPHAMRLHAYERRMAKEGLTPRVVFSEPFETDARAAARSLLRQSSVPTAIFAGNDTLAIGVLSVVAELGLDPAAIAVAGYDDIDLAGHGLVSLTTVDQFGDEMGAAAVRLLLERIQSGGPSRRHVIDPVLRVRRSTVPTLDPHLVPQGHGTFSEA